jgi:hypothetical protein
MKSKNMNRVADRIEAIAKADAKRVTIGFNMGSLKAAAVTKTCDLTGHDCGTVACIAGHAYLEAGHTPSQLKKANTAVIWSVAKEFFGITEFEAEDLFAPYTLMNTKDVGRLSNIPLDMAVATLRASASAKRITWVRPL